MNTVAKIFFQGIVLSVCFSIILAGCDDKKEQSKNNVQLALEALAKEKTPENYLTLSLRYYEAGQYEKSIEAAQQSLTLRPQYALAYNNICAAYNALSNWDKGIEACQQALKIDPDFQLAKNNLDWALSAKKQKR